jgi:hypothetical protein
MSEHQAIPATDDRATVEVSATGAADVLPKPLDEINSMDAYLQNYGKILGRQAIATLAPLHVPGRDPLPEFDDLGREPFEPQKHVVAAAVQMMDESGSGFICGEMGCIAGESEVYDPVAGHYRRVDEITEPFHVIAYHDGKAVVGKADVPFIKGTRDLYRVTLAITGESFVCTDHHRLQTRDHGFQTLRWILDNPDARLVAVATARGCTASGVDRIAKAEFLRNDVFYDFTVAEFHNYVMAGVVHHNTGKTLIGMTSIHQHAKRSGRKGGSNGRYRAIVLCPDHLISKWEREIKETIPEATIYRFDDWRGVARLLGRGRKGRWPKPQGAEYYIIGRNQAKWYPDWLGTSDPYRGFLGRRVQSSLSSRNVIVDRAPVTDDDGKPVSDARGGTKLESVTARVFACPRCGSVARDRKALPLSAKDISNKKINCEGKYLQMLPQADKKHQHGLDRLCPMPERFKDSQPGHEVNVGGHRYVVTMCGEPLWAFTSKPYRWAPSRIVQKKMRQFFKYLLIDEAHEAKSEISGQSMAAGKLIASVKHTLALTGTLIGGYADHLFPLMMRMTPETLRAEGFEWGKDLAFSEAYGRIDRIISTREDGATTSIGKSVRSMRRAKSGKSNERKAVRPGIMPTLFGRHMIGSSVFITLGEMADELPALHEYIGGPPTGDQGTDPFYIDTCCPMESDQRAEYQRIESILKSECTELLKRGSMKLLGAMLWTTLGWPDVCSDDWGGDDDLTRAIEQGAPTGRATADRVEHTVGYWNKPGSRDVNNWVGVLTPTVLDKSIVYPKEEALIDICLRHKAARHQVWVYAQMTQKRNVTHRLKALLERYGLKVGIMRSGDVDPKEREDWIAKHGREFDVMICHPKLVSTGLDLFSKTPGGHNYNCLVFYQTGYNLFDMRQAARRAWRIGQPNDCYVYYLYYRETMQQRAMSLMSKKMAAAHALEGEFSEEGLAAMAGEDNLQMALAKSLAERIEDADMQRSWVKIKSGDKREAHLRVATLRMTPTVDRRAGSVAEPATRRLQIHIPDSEPEHPGLFHNVDVPVFDEALLSRMLANLAANGMTLNDLAG